MKKGIVFISLMAFLLFGGTQVASAFFSSVFGGRIVSSKATEIEALESVGYSCLVFGSTFTIMPIGSPAGTPLSYFVPTYVTPKSGARASEGKLTMGKYTGMATITCILDTGEYVDIKTVTLPTISKFTTSKN